MKAAKRIGIWMDHAHANLMEFTVDPIETKTVQTDFTHVEKEATLSKSESLMHNTEHHDQHHYYKQLGEVIKGYDEVLLFGPTDAKVELYNILKKDHLFEKIKIEVASTDKLNDAQQHAYVKDHFSKHPQAV
jgi:hypothetical protein